MKTDEQLIAGLRKAIGYIENGSSDVLRICQYDATKEFTATIGRNTYTYSKSFRGLLEKIADLPDNT